VPVEVIGIDHVYLAVRDLGISREFYDRVMRVLGYRTIETAIAGDPHVHYYNRHFGFSLRPARPATPTHDPYAPGLHHFCFRVVDEAAVDRAAAELCAEGIETTEPRFYGEYSADYYAIFFADPDGVRLEVTNFREIRRRRMFDWNHEPGSSGAPRSGGRRAENAGEPEDHGGRS
jgi:glyoxylase I family protein